MKVSIVSPVYHSEKFIQELVYQIHKSIIEITDDFEIILVDDCGQDNSWQKIKEQGVLFPFVKGIRLSRNFGQHSAIKAGIDAANGDCCIVMDCDLQDDPKYFKNLIKKWEEGNDIVYTYKSKREHSYLKNLSAKFFNRIFNFLVENKTFEKSNKNIGSYSLISKKVMEAFKKYNDYQFHYLMVLRWLGFQFTYVNIKHRKRFSGKSSYTIKKLIDHALVAIIYQSDKLLKISIYLGFLISFLSILAVLLVFVLYFVNGFQSGWASLFILNSFFAGVILTAIGILGLYIGKTFEQVKRRPQYVIDKKINL